MNPDQYAKPATKEEVIAASRKLSEEISEAKEFLVYLQTGDERPLRACRERIGWPSPKWIE